jgi:ABC-2 type transport system ATP-binding protein
LDEPTSGLDPLVRREFIRAVIGAFLEGDPERRTVFISTHLITEFEGLIDRFTVIEKGRELATMDTEEARSTYRRIRAHFAGPPPQIDTSGALSSEVFGREISILVNGDADAMLARVEAHQPLQVEVEALGLEDIFLANLRGERG